MSVRGHARRGVVRVYAQPGAGLGHLPVRRRLEPVSRVAALLVLCASTAFAAPPDRVLLADPDPELLHAVESSLSPWRLTIVVERDAPADDGTARTRADVTGARFVVWREGDQLVVLDLARAASERRPARAGNFDAISAAAAALTVKTMMRLPPPPPEDAEIVTPSADGAHVELRLEIGGAARIANGDDGLGTRAELAAMLRPSSARGWRVGVRGDFGTSASIDAGGFKGSWQDFAMLAAASWTHTRGAWEIEPWLGAGVARGTLDGTEMAGTPRLEHATLFTVHGGGSLRRRFGAFTAGPGLVLAATPAAPTYTRTTPGMGMPSLFEASKFSVVVGLTVAIDLGR